MKPNKKRALFQTVLVPILYGCDERAAMAAAAAIVGPGNLELVGLVPIPLDQSLSTAAQVAQRLRRKIGGLREPTRRSKPAHIYATHTPWSELVMVIAQLRPDLLILEWPAQIEALGTTLEDVLSRPPCDVAIVNRFAGEKMNKVLVSIRGGPYAELALRIALSMHSSRASQISTLHVFPAGLGPGQDAAFRGIERVLRNLPQIQRHDVVTDDPYSAIADTARQHDLLILGASARPQSEVSSIGPLATRLLHESRKGVIVVKTRRPAPALPESEEAGQNAISVLVDKWFAGNTYDADEFLDLDELLRRKQELRTSISLALPSLNEEKTVGDVIRTLQKALCVRVPLVDEIVLMDSGSSDRTRKIAEGLGIPTHIHQEILPQYGARHGKGEALWKSLYCTHGDIIVWVDSDITNIHPRFVYGLIGPLLFNPEIQLVKGFYRRPLRVGGRLQAAGGGRVTELTARPLLNLFFPELSGLVQPLSGEYGGRRRALEQLPFFSGYGVEVGLLIDVFERFGLDSIAQANLQERIHHNQPLEALSKMSFAIIQAVIHRIERRYGGSLLETVNKTMKLIRFEQNRLFLDIEEIAELERPPIGDLPEYKARHAV